MSWLGLLLTFHLSHLFPFFSSYSSFFPHRASTVITFVVATSDNSSSSSSSSFSSSSSSNSCHHHHRPRAAILPLPPLFHYYSRASSFSFSSSSPHPLPSLLILFFFSPICPWYIKKILLGLVRNLSLILSTNLSIEKFIGNRHYKLLTKFISGIDYQIYYQLKYSSITQILIYQQILSS